MSHTPSHIDNAGGGGCSFGRIPLVGVLTPFSSYKRGLKKSQNEKFLSYNESIPFINNTGLDLEEGDHVGYRLMVVGTEDARFVFAIDLFKIDEDTSEETWDDLQNTAVMHERLLVIKTIKMSYNPDSKSSKLLSDTGKPNELSQLIHKKAKSIYSRLGLQEFKLPKSGNGGRRL